MRLFQHSQPTQINRHAPPIQSGVCGGCGLRKAPCRGGGALALDTAGRAHDPGALDCQRLRVDSNRIEAANSGEAGTTSERESPAETRGEPRRQTSSRTGCDDKSEPSPTCQLDLAVENLWGLQTPDL